MITKHEATTEQCLSGPLHTLNCELEMQYFMTTTLYLGMGLLEQSGNVVRQIARKRVLR